LWVKRASLGHVTVPKWVVGMALYRVYRASREVGWFFAVDPERPERGGRFDPPAPEGACYLCFSLCLKSLWPWPNWSVLPQ
jgi:hypothetical protein